MSKPAPAKTSLHHHARRMTGRDPHEDHRVATPLELLFDLTFVLSFGFAASQFAHAIAAGHFGTALAGFGLASFAICWAWINFTWFSSAYDTDDWLFRLTTMVLMIGALIFAIGLPPMFASIEHDSLGIGTIVLGYVVMRCGMVAHWLRAARANPARRAACLTYAVNISLVQIGWVALALAHLPVRTSFILAALLVLIEVSGPVIAEYRFGGTPWHAHHIAERYALFAIIALGEGVVGTVAAVSAVVQAQGWTLDAALVSIAGIGLTFGMWWVYYMMPSAPILHAHRERSFVWGYGQMFVFAAIVATGAGLHVAAYFIEGHTQIGTVATVLTVAIPVAIYLVLIYALYSYLVRRFDPFHFWLLLGTAVMIALSVALAVTGVDMAACLIVLMLAPVVTVIGYETLGHRHQAAALEANEAAPAPEDVASGYY
ncbi:MAG: low temperature requirement protein A [Sphingobium sp.]|nr:low temperature requirement protein A [Sphingobium sp.]